MDVLPQPPRACGQQGDGPGMKLILKYPMESWKGIFRWFMRDTVIIMFDRFGHISLHTESTSCSSSRRDFFFQSI